MATLGRNHKILLDLVQQPGNNLCADCAAPEPDWASYTLGVFVCLNCSGMHRNLPTVSKVKSIRLDYWEDSLIKFMQERGNSAAKAIFEKCVPAFFYKPQQKDCIVLKDQWIRAKYERREFTGENNYFLQAYNSDLFESTLWKKGKDNRQFLKRIFLLSQKDFTLRYFIKEDSKVPKAVISMKDLNAHFQPEKIGHNHGLQISYLEDERTRNIFVYHEDGQAIVSFFNAIRATRLAYLLKKHPTLQNNELIPQISTHCLKEGYMEKTGPTQREPFKKRWFTLCSMNRKLLYFKSSLVMNRENKMLQSWALSSLAQKTMATLCQRAAAGAQGEAGGTAGSHWRLRGGSLCSCVNRCRSRESGWRPSEESSLNP
ncbi:arf-GAP with dual PH domain-containing protein 2-like isoform X2 [Leuresthes tenuis]|uniref:arf-GAP with dual PH domain-containing protein 2-like isoform X2 n=1 Tax=Leuresthes tenuis TaxID=355514 RepID=UPI003B51297D